MYVIVGLGNPGDKYAHTRHNAGYDVVEVLSQQSGIRLTRTRCKARVGEGRIGGKPVALCKPQTYMNLSGESVVALCNWYKPEPDQLILVYDDVDLPFGRLRFRTQGSAGTHNGMRSIVYLLGRDDFPRVRVGIGRPPEQWDLKDYVLTGYHGPEERKIAFDAFLAAARTLELYLEEGAQRAAAFANAYAGVAGP
ncbi:MAG: aminoacyl-tRNA hydrolase [Candidatus Excrementavichristensenella sp.]|jgi:PTH1 family peptidyl-tRNA hydrolase